MKKERNISEYIMAIYAQVCEKLWLTSSEANLT